MKRAGKVKETKYDKDLAVRRPKFFGAAMRGYSSEEGRKEKRPETSLDNWQKDSRRQESQVVFEEDGCKVTSDYPSNHGYKDPNSYEQNLEN